MADDRRRRQGGQRDERQGHDAGDHRLPVRRHHAWQGGLPLEIHLERAPANTRYHWEVGDPTYLASKDVASSRTGPRRVFAKTVRDAASGQKVGCSIWTSGN
ncbi:hypothetical protein [Mesorhizobium sp. B4-1-1]|uniref:hypothetical protein n=1 Tax=Mesorhizobium sp. B4-1-1 TaxID=2589890 RepID=UPI00112D0405|nr:hypothetical protein [Mesorhizobium sp. B4-1-1]TPI19726.1 hypothetical protein FJW10_13320 [Mesorhizobium sp. B4-1-1]